MKTVSLLLLFILGHFNINAQTNEDLCEQWRKTKDDMENYEDSFEFNYKMLSKVSLKCKVEIYISTARFYRDQQKLDSAIVNFDKAIKLSHELNLSSEAVLAYVYKAYTVAQRGKLQESKELLKKAKIHLDKAPKNKDWNDYYISQAYLSDINSEYKEAVAYTDSSITFSKKRGIDSYARDGYINKGTYLLRMSDFEGAIKSYIKAITLAEEDNELGNMDVYYHLLANTYKRMKQHVTALKYFNKSLEYSKKKKNDYITMLTYSRMTSSSIALKQYDNALASIDSTIVNAELINDYATISSVYSDKAGLYFVHLKDDDKAEYYFKKSYENSLKASNSKKNDDLLKVKSLQGMVRINLKKKQFKEAKLFLKKLENETDKSGLLLYKRTLNGLYSDYYEGVGQLDKAIKYLKAYHILKDSLSDDKVKTQVAKLEKQYSTASKELQIANLDKEKETQKQLASKANTKQKVYLAIAFISLVLLGISYWLFNKLKKQKTELDAANNTKNRLFSIIAHDLRGMIIPFRRSGRVLQHYIENKDYNKTLVFSQELQKNSEGLSRMLDNLLNWSVEQMNGYKMNPELIYVSEELENVKSNFKQQSDFKKTKIEIINSEEIVINMDKGAFHIIFRNLISNGLKYTENGSIRLEFLQENNILKFNIIDTGLGMNTEQMACLFRLEKKPTTGTKGEKGAGLGLNLVHRFVTMNNGDIKVSSEKRVGTKFEINFPLTKTDIIETKKVNERRLLA